MPEAHEFGRMSAAREFREENSEHLAPEDDARRKTVQLLEGAPDDVHESAEFEAAASRGDSERGAEQIPLTEREKDQFDFSRDGLNVFKLRSVKGIARDEGVDDWVAFVDPNVSTSGHREIMERAARDERGARQDAERSDDERARELEKQQKSAECDHAEGFCKNGDVEACEFLAEACGYDEEEVEQLLGGDFVDRRDRDDDVDQEGDESEPEQQTVTVGGGEFGTLEVSPEEAGALSRSWQGYKGAVNRLESTLEDVREATVDARQAMSAINAIRGEHGQDDLHPDRLHQLVEALGGMPESIPETRTLDHFGEFDDQEDKSIPKAPQTEARARTIDVDEQGEAGATRIDLIENAISDLQAYRRDERMRATEAVEAFVDNFDGYPGVVDQITSEPSNFLTSRPGRVRPSLERIVVQNYSADELDEFRRTFRDAVEATIASEPSGRPDFQDPQRSIPKAPQGPPRGRPIDVNEREITTLDEAIDYLSSEVDGYGDRVGADADFVRYLEGYGLDPGVFEERQSQDLFRYGIDAEDLMTRWSEQIEAVNGDPEDYRLATINFAREKAGFDELLQDTVDTAAPSSSSDVGAVGVGAAENEGWTVEDVLDMTDADADAARWIAANTGGPGDLIQLVNTEGSLTELPGVGDSRAAQMRTAAARLEAAGITEFVDAEAWEENPDRWRDMVVAKPGSSSRDDVIETDDQQTLGGGRADPQARLAGGEQGARGQGEVETEARVEQNPGGMMADERENPTGESVEERTEQSIPDEFRVRSGGQQGLGEGG